MSRSSLHYAILFLDDLDVQRCQTHSELKHMVGQLSCGFRPFAVLRYTERSGREIWHVRNVHYQDQP